MNWSGGMGATGWVFMSIVLLLLIAAAVWLVSALPRRSDRLGATSVAERPEQILGRRLASGEIDADAYDVLQKKFGARVKNWRQS